MADSQNQFELLAKRRFLPFFITQFLGAFNDNIFKNALIILIVYQAANWTNVSSIVLINLCAGLFILPFFLLSAMAGQLADKYEKSHLMRIVKLMEIVIMLMAAVGFYRHDIYFLMFVLLLTGIQATFFGPVKYSILPQHLRDTELVGGNGLIEMGTFVAILVGTLCGGVLISQGITGVMISVVMVAILGYVASRFIPLAPANDPSLKISWEPFSQTWKNIQFARHNRTVFLSILGNSWFWFFGTVVLTQIPEYVKVILGGSETVVTLLLTAFSMGVGIGSLLCERLSGHRVELGLVPFGSIGITLFGIDLFFAHPAVHQGALLNVTTFLQTWSNIHVVLDCVLLGVFSGFYIVPLFALIQQRSKPEQRSRIIAANNIINALFMVVASMYGVFVLKIGFSLSQLFLITAILNAVVAIYIYKLVPEFLMRFIVWVCMSLVYRARATGLEHIPEEGPAVIVCNHVSFVDALILMSVIRRPIRFVMHESIFKIPLLSFVFKTSGAIPIASAKENLACREAAFASIQQTLAAGELVGLFPEGGITRDGEIQPFKSGIERIVRETAVPVVPVALGGLWGSLFSRKHKGVLRGLPRKLWSKIRVSVGEPVVPQAVTKDVLYEMVTTLQGGLR